MTRKQLPAMQAAPRRIAGEPPTQYSIMQGCMHAAMHCSHAWGCVAALSCSTSHTDTCPQHPGAVVQQLPSRPQSNGVQPGKPSQHKIRGSRRIQHSRMPQNSQGSIQKSAAVPCGIAVARACTHGSAGSMRTRRRAGGRSGRATHTKTGCSGN